MPARNRIAVLIVAFAVALIGLVPGSASAASVPYSDPSASGYLGFCDANNHQVTSGSIQTQPFVVKAVASTSAPNHYGPPYGRAVLYVFQPIQYVDPSNWSGKQMTGATAFTNTKAPMAIATVRDPSMVNFSSVYPLHVDGFAQVRMYYTALGQTQFSSSYPAANIKITGNTWTQIGGGKVNCTAGQAHSNEIALGAPTAFPTNSGSKGSTSASGATSGSTSGGTPGSSSASDGGSADPQNASHNTKSSSNGGLIALIVIVVVLLGGGGFYLVLRRRNKVTV